MSSTRRTKRPRDASPADPSASLAAGAALQRSAVALGHARRPPAEEVDGTGHWPPAGHLSETVEARERLAHTGERQVWAAQDAVETAFARAVTAYAHLLRDGGMRPRQVAAAVAAVVRDAATPSLHGNRLDVAIHDAGRYAVEAYFAR
jgi:hypothetical protein